MAANAIQPLRDLAHALAGDDEAVIGEDEDIRARLHRRADGLGQRQARAAIGNERPFDPARAAQPLGDRRLGVRAHGQGDRVDAVNMHHHRMRQASVDARLDGGSQMPGISRLIDETGDIVGARIVARERVAHGGQIYGNHYVLVEGVGKPAAGGFDPHDAVALERRVAAGGLGAKRIAPERRRERQQRFEFRIAVD